MSLQTPSHLNESTALTKDKSSTLTDLQQKVTSTNGNGNCDNDAKTATDRVRKTSLNESNTEESKNSASISNKLDTSIDNNKLQNITKKRTRSMYPHQQKNYGPKATLKKVAEDYLLVVQDPLSQQLCWTKPPLYILVIKKPCNTIFEPFTEVIKFLMHDHNLIVYVEEDDYENEIFRLDDQIRQAMKPCGSNTKPSLRKFCQPSSNYSCRCAENADVNKIDLVVCLGGDGTLLHVSTLFQKSCPPVLSIHMGSLGFLCPFDFLEYREYINGVVKGGVPLLLRNRLRCRLEKSDNTSQDSIVESSGISSKSPDGANQPEDLIALNEVVISRGPSPYLSNLDLYVNDYLITTVQGDGLIISTPTGSTAYAMAAGASMCHPSVQSIIIAPICPHSLSFRPIVVPAGVELKIALNDEARNPSAWYSVDGRNTTELKQGYHISITTSEYPLPSICRSDQINDWFEGLATCLHWNQRQKQLPINDCYLRSRTQSLASLQSQSQMQSSLSSKSSSTSSLKFNLNNNLTVISNKLQNFQEDETNPGEQDLNESAKLMDNLKLNTSTNGLTTSPNLTTFLSQSKTKSTNDETKLITFNITNDNLSA